MDSDFHFGTMYVLARWADFGSDNCKILAASSQFVDDNYDESAFSDKPEEAAKKKGIDVRYSCEDFWSHMTNKSDAEVWVPYHFLPGLEGRTEEEKLVCKKNSKLANRLAERLNATSCGDANFAFRLGIGSHVYADTWAHQEFAGINNALNQVKDLIFSQQGSMVQRVLDDVVDSKVMNKVLDMLMPLGHAAAIHCPDIPYLWWHTGERFLGGRKNWDEFLEASQRIFLILQHVSGDTQPEGLTAHQLQLLMEMFKGVQTDDIEERLAAWTAKIHSNYFEFKNFDGIDGSLEYNKSFILDDEDFRRQFYQEINAHYDWVKSALVTEDIHCLS